MSQDQLLSVVQAFQASKAIAVKDQEQLTELQKSAAAVMKSAPSAFAKTTMKGATELSLAARKSEFRVNYSSPGGSKHTYESVKAPTLKSVGTDLIKSVAKGAVRDRLKQQGGVWYYIAWAWQGSDAAVKLLKPGHPALKVLEVGFYVSKLTLEVQKSYLEKKTAEMAAEIDWVLKLHTDVADRMIADMNSLASEANSAGVKIMPKWGQDKKGFMQQLLKEVAVGRAGDSHEGKLLVQSIVRRSVLNDLAYLHDLRAAAYSLGAAADAMAIHLGSLAENPASKALLPKELQNYTGKVLQERPAILRMFANDLTTGAGVLQSTTERIYNIEFNLWSLIAGTLGAEGPAP